MNQPSWVKDYPTEIEEPWNKTFQVINQVWYHHEVINEDAELICDPMLSKREGEPDLDSDVIFKDGKPYAVFGAGVYHLAEPYRPYPNVFLSGDNITWKSEKGKELRDLLLHTYHDYDGRRVARLDSINAALNEIYEEDPLWSADGYHDIHQIVYSWREQSEGSQEEQMNLNRSRAERIMQKLLELGYEFEYVWDQNTPKIRLKNQPQETVSV